ncbi:MAG TPA: phage tail protein, partial [Longimicrobium sp.]|nr:phage tail protein [Longimicrobium sp.]
PPRLRVLPDAAWAGERAAAVATSPAGRVAVLAWREDGQGTVRVLQDDGAMSDPVVLEGAWVPYSLAWVSEGRVAVLLVDEKQAAAYDLPEAEDLAKRTGQARTAAQAGDVYPLQGHDGGPFQHGPGAVPHYPTLPGSSPLHALSLPSFAQQGRAWSAQVLDAGVAGATWHRLYLEACIPPRCSISLYLAASETHATPRDEAAWFEHRFGGSAAAADREVPRGAWVPQRSELPYHPGVLQAEPAKDRAGLWTALVQRAGRRVRALRGRYLHVRAELRGDGLASPELAAVRAYGPRFSYRDRYLPELYRESVFGAEADLPARSTPADFLERFLGNFEGILTGIEDRIAHAHLLTDPRTVPAESLEWLAGWIGVSLDPALPEARRRDLLAAAPELARLRGTPRGIALALELATGGGVSGGEIVLVEDFRLRRTFATILGADLEDEDDPLLCGLARSGNSYVGDTLFLGDERSKAFLALFDADLPLNAWEQAQVAAFFERLAHRMTVLVHQEVEPQDLGLIRRIVQREAPAHVEWRVVTAPSPLVVGAASLVGVDTYLGRKRARRHVSVDRSRVGADFVLEPVSLDRRTGGGAAYAPPVARLSGPETVGIDGPVPLDGGGSRAAPGHDLTQYRWTRRPE